MVGKKERGVYQLLLVVVVVVSVSKSFFWFKHSTHHHAGQVKPSFANFNGKKKYTHRHTTDKEVYVVLFAREKKTNDFFSLNLFSFFLWSGFNLVVVVRSNVHHKHTRTQCPFIATNDWFFFIFNSLI